MSISTYYTISISLTLYLYGFVNLFHEPFVSAITGVPGGWRKHLTPEMNEKFNSWMGRNLARADLAGLTDAFPSTFTLE